LSPLAVQRDLKNSAGKVNGGIRAMVGETIKKRSPAIVRENIVGFETPRLVAIEAEYYLG